MKSNDPVLKRFGLKSFSQKLKYDKFINLFMLTGRAEESYGKVYPKGNKHTNKKRSYELVRHPYVIYEINRKNKEIDKKMEKDIIMNRERILKELEEILILTKGKEQYAPALKALDQLARVTGAYAPEKSEVEHKGITINYIEPSDEPTGCNGECNGNCECNI